MSAAAQVMSPSEASRALGVSVKALRLYEQRGLVAPIRSSTGWRAYGPRDMAMLREIVALRALGLSLAQIARVLGSEASALELVLAAHEAALDGKCRQIAAAIETIRQLRTGFAARKAPADTLSRPDDTASVAFDLPWPWGGERFELGEVKPLTYIIGPLGSGKTRLAQRIAEVLPDAAFLGLDRLLDDGAAARSRVKADAMLALRVERALLRLIENGATRSSALVALLAALEAPAPAVLVVDMVEQGLDQATQVALSAYLRSPGASGRPLFLMTRSSSILDLAAAGPDEAIIFCPANHAPPSRVLPYAGTPGHEAVATCLASPAVRARTEGVIAWRPQVA